MSGRIFAIFYALFIWFGTAQIGYWLNKLSRHVWPAVLSGIFCAVMGALPFAGLYMPVSGYARSRMIAVSNQWLAFFLPMTGLMLAAFILRRIRKHRTGYLYEPKASSCAVLLIVSCSFCGLADLYGACNAHTLHLTEYDIDLSESSKVHGQEKIVLLSDLHLGVNGSEKQLKETVDMVNAQNPDLIVCTGDFFNNSYDGIPDPDTQSAILAGMTARDGKYAVYGNHDVDEPLLCGVSMAVQEPERPEGLEQLLQNSRVTMLEDETVTVGDLQITGRKDEMHPGGDGTRLGAHALLRQTEADRPDIVLQHEPDEFDTLAEAGADLVLAGHTHGGQIFPGKYFSAMAHENVYGLKKLHGIDTIVTSGAGYYGAPVRIGSISEIVVINLTY